MRISDLYLPSLRAQPSGDNPNSIPGRVPSSQVHPTNNLKRLLQILTSVPMPCLLDLGRLKGPNIEWLIHKGIKVFVDDRTTSLRPAAPPPAPQKGEKKLPPPSPLEPLDYPPMSFDAVLCWDLLDYLVLMQAREIVAGIARILKPKGLLLAFFNFNRSLPVPPTCYRIVREDQLEYEPLPQNSIPRRIYENREIQELFSKFDTLNSCFLKNQMREVLVQKR
jgi:SAM-dependent methyltransferase